MPPHAVRLASISLPGPRRARVFCRCFLPGRPDCRWPRRAWKCFSALSNLARHMFRASSAGGIMRRPSESSRLSLAPRLPLHLDSSMQPTAYSMHWTRRPRSLDDGDGVVLAHSTAMRPATHPGRRVVWPPPCPRRAGAGAGAGAAPRVDVWLCHGNPGQAIGWGRAVATPQRAAAGALASNGHGHGSAAEAGGACRSLPAPVSHVVCVWRRARAAPRRQQQRPTRVTPLTEP
jgi:hypothetical protein